MSGVSESHDDCALQPDPDLWMSDGNVVLSVKDAEGVTWGLRCHQSILARHSAVFATLFTLNQPSHSGQYDGVPIVILPDPYEEVKSLLQMLAYDPVKYVQLEPGLTGFHSLNLFILKIYSRLCNTIAPPKRRTRCHHGTSLLVSQV